MTDNLTKEIATLKATIEEQKDTIRLQKDYTDFLEGHIKSLNEIIALYQMEDFGSVKQPTHPRWKVTVNPNYGKI